MMKRAEILIREPFIPADEKSQTECTPPSILGSRKQQKEPLFTKDSGLGMMFRKFDGTLMYSLHQPNSGPEHPCIFPFPDQQAKLL